ncbi:hypothetical protein BAE44_0025749 [Dichanthelium oligosanthes]|uniref:Uncharacterized protein n=1 Tax=Dichanthelium oligosanthes TaxID=888268 RepID=A0A1E5UK27_9POAL|nr:hypothetical protein BAE44_0025749 [Dichanthelium oligosanthes]
MGLCAGGYGGVQSGQVPECLQPHDHLVTNRERRAPVFGLQKSLSCGARGREGVGQLGACERDALAVVG